MLYIIRADSMRRFQWYKACCNSSKTHGATPKYGNGGKRHEGHRFLGFCAIASCSIPLEPAR
jgi:hypothetical protein